MSINQSARTEAHGMISKVYLELLKYLLAKLAIKDISKYAQKCFVLWIVINAWRPPFQKVQLLFFVDFHTLLLSRTAIGGSESRSCL